MAKRSHTREPDDEPDAEPAEDNELHELEEPEAEAAPPEVGALTSQTQINNHTQAVTVAKGSLQSSVAAATAAKLGGGTQSAYVAAVKNADIAYYQSVIASAATNGIPVGGAIDALKQLGAY